MLNEMIIEISLKSSGKIQSSIIITETETISCPKYAPEIKRKQAIKKTINYK